MENEKKLSLALEKRKNSPPHHFTLRFHPFLGPYSSSRYLRIGPVS